MALAAPSPAGHQITAHGRFDFACRRWHECEHTQAVAQGDRGSGSRLVSHHYQHYLPTYTHTHTTQHATTTPCSPDGASTLNNVQAPMCTARPLSVRRSPS